MSAPPAASPPVPDLASRASRWMRKARWPLLVVWLVALAVSGIGAASIANTLSGGGWYAPGADSTAAAHQLETGFKGRGQTTVTLVVHDQRFTESDARFERRVKDVAHQVTEDRTLKVSDSYGWVTLGKENRSSFLGDDRRTVTTQLALDLDDGAARRELPVVQQDLTDRFSDQGLEVSLVSPSSFWVRSTTSARRAWPRPS